MKNVLKITVFSASLALGVTFAVPHTAHALLLDSLFENAPYGPHCLFMDCHDKESAVVNNVVNSNNTNSFNNNTAPITGQVGTTGGTVVNTSPYQVSAATPAAASTNTNYNYNYNTSGGSGSTVYVPTYSSPTYYPAYYQSPSYYYQQPTYYYNTTPYQYQSTYYYTPTSYQYRTYNPPVAYAQGIQIACAADTTTTRVGVPVTWTAEALYNNSALGFSYSWSGTEGLYGYQSSAIMTYYSLGVKSAIVTVTAPNGETQSRVCTNTVTVKSNYVAKAPVVAKPKTPTTPPQVVYAPVPKPEQISAASLFSLGNVPWGWVGILIILILLGVILYLIFNKKKI